MVQHAPASLTAANLTLQQFGWIRAGMVTECIHLAPPGRQQLYQLEADKLAESHAPWLARYERDWSNALKRLRGLAEDPRPPSPK